MYDFIVSHAYRSAQIYNCSYLDMGNNMKKIIMCLFTGLAVSFFSASVFAKDLCEMPPDIDDGKKYWIKFKVESKMYIYKITDIDDCWIQVEKKNKSKYWFQVQDVATIIAEPVK